MEAQAYGLILILLIDEVHHICCVFGNATSKKSSFVVIVISGQLRFFVRWQFGACDYVVVAVFAFILNCSSRIGLDVSICTCFGCFIHRICQL